jgi:hypothetical protein
MADELLEVLHGHFAPDGGDENFRGDDYLHAFGRASEALLYSALFLPDLMEVDGSILLTRGLPHDDRRRDFLAAKRQGNEDLSELEASFNFVEVGYLFGPHGRDISDEEDELLARRIAEAWRGCLKVRYPERKCAVRALSPEETGSTVGVCFYEVR